MKKILVLATMFIGITISSVAATSAVPFQAKTVVVEEETVATEAEETREGISDFTIEKPSLSSGGLSQITEIMREIVRKEQKKQTEGIQKNHTGWEES